MTENALTSLWGAQLAILLDLLARPVVPVSAVVPASMWKPGAIEDPGDVKGCP